MKNLIVIPLIFCLTGTLKSQTAQPIIDMHLHAIDQGNISETRFCFPEPCERAPTIVKEASELLPYTLEQMNKYNIVLGALSGYDYEVVKRWGNKDPRLLISPVIWEPMRTNLKELEQDIKDGKVTILGEVTSQYWGYKMNDMALDPIFSLAEKYDLPILVHSAGLGGIPNFPAEKGNPLNLNEVIRKHPKLRIYIENAAWPFGDEIISLMYTNPNVYADLSTISWIIPRITFHKYLEKLVDAGLSKRLMFGSDQMFWPETIGLAVDAINSADFLSDEQKRDIFYNNAARFLKLSDEQIAKHHDK